MKKNFVKYGFIAALVASVAFVGIHREQHDAQIGTQQNMTQAEKGIPLAQQETEFFTGPASALAQAGISYDKFGTRTLGGQSVPTTVPTLWCTVWSDTAGTIKDGTVVVIDTTTTSPTRIVVKGWTNTALTRGKILGLAYGDIPGSNIGMAGKVLITGFHGNAKMGASGLTANLPIKTNLAASGSLTTVADSLSGAVGWFIGHSANSTAANSRGKVYILRPMGFVFLTL